MRSLTSVSISCLFQPLCILSPHHCVLVFAFSSFSPGLIIIIIVVVIVDVFNLSHFTRTALQRMKCNVRQLVYSFVTIFFVRRRRRRVLLLLLLFLSTIFKLAPVTNSCGCRSMMLARSCSPTDDCFCIHIEYGNDIKRSNPLNRIKLNEMCANIRSERTYVHRTFGK